MIQQPIGAAHMAVARAFGRYIRGVQNLHQRESSTSISADDKGLAMNLR
jgi:hypothetical protein